MSENHSGAAFFAAFAAYVIYGFSFMASSIAMSYVTPSMLLALRFLVSFSIMTLVMLTGRGKLNLSGKPVGKFLLLGLCQPVIYFIGEANGIRYTTSSFSGIMISLVPVVTAMLSPLILKEKFSLRTLWWILVSVFGVAVISVSQKGSGVIEARGVLYLLVAVVSASLFAILSSALAGQFTSFERTYVMMFMGAVFFTGSALLEHGASFGADALAAVREPALVLPVLYLAVVSSVIAFFCQNYAMTYLEVTKAITLANITPLVSVVAGVVFLHETFLPVHAAGFALILLGVYMVSRK